VEIVHSEVVAMEETMVETEVETEVFNLGVRNEK
jgi:hypothetical protein